MEKRSLVSASGMTPAPARAPGAPVTPSALPFSSVFLSPLCLCASSWVFAPNCPPAHQLSPSSAFTMPFSPLSSWALDVGVTLMSAGSSVASRAAEIPVSPVHLLGRNSHNYWKASASSRVRSPCELFVLPVIPLGFCLWALTSLYTWLLLDVS